MTEDKNSLTESTSTTSSVQNSWGIYVEHNESKKTKWVGMVDYALLSYQRDELVEFNREEENENLEGIILFLDALIDAYLDIKSTL